MQPEIYKDEGYKLMGAAFEVSNEQGGGMAEEIYQESLEIELGLQSIPFGSKRQVECFYKDQQLQKRYLPDLVAFDGIIVELKAVAALLPEHEEQLFNYIRITRQPVGYLINFGAKEKLEWKRFILAEFIPLISED